MANFMKYVESMKAFAGSVLEADSLEWQLNRRKEEFRAGIWFLLGSIVVLGAVCIGVMYLRFRVFGR